MSVVAAIELPLVRSIAFYLPQFHPIPENDRWWGPGFTEWTNVARARPLFPGHRQPIIPADLGFYDLRVPETRVAQADLAKAYGVEGFCYWHYWFAGKRLLERPFNEVLRSGEPDFPFCLAWANSSWTGIWHGAPRRVLIEQTYPGDEDTVAHFQTLEPAFHDPRHLRVEGKPIFVVYAPQELPEPRRFTDRWRDLARRSGLTDMFIVGLVGHAHPGLEAEGFDGWVTSVPDFLFGRSGESLPLLHPGRSAISLAAERVIRAVSNTLHSRLYRSGPRVLSYRTAIQRAEDLVPSEERRFPCVFPGWDNTPRSRVNGWVFLGSTPELFGEHVHQAVARIASRPRERRLLWIKSWNEWAEGNFLEPDEKFGHAYLKRLRLETVHDTKSAP